MMYLVIHVVFIVIASDESGTINKLILLILACASEKEKKNHVISAAKNNIPKVITASIIDSPRCRAVIRRLSALELRLGEWKEGGFLMFSVLTV